MNSRNLGEETESLEVRRWEGLSKGGKIYVYVVWNLELEVDRFKFEVIVFLNG